MNHDLHKRFIYNSEAERPGRRKMLGLLAFGLAVPLAACSQGSKKMKDDAVLSVEAFPFVDRVLTTIMFNGEDLAS